MKLVADFHIHSRFSRATSKELSPEEIDYWARLKGLAIVGTGDFTHPKWREELKEKLEPAEPGLYKLKDGFRIKERLLPETTRPVRFLFSAEISCIYKKQGAVRKLHHLILAPGIESAESISRKIARIGNLNSDGRPILGLDSKNLLELVLEDGKGAVLIPAHIWTPWFSLFGSMSGFDAIEQCFEDLTREIFALETGLSSNPEMNWRLETLDRFTLVSNSDAHSPANLAREANIFNCDMDYNQIMAALHEPAKGFLGTIEFFPEEGKYHFDGHRKCGVRLSPKETRKYRGLCPECGKPVTVGVMNRVEALADREKPQKPMAAPGFISLVPLSELLGQIYQTGSQSKKVGQEYFRLLKKLGPELDILMELPEPKIERESPLLALAITRMRAGKVLVEAGFDGEYGKVRVFKEDELKKLRQAQTGFFAEPEAAPEPQAEKSDDEQPEPEEVSPDSFLEGMLFPGAVSNKSGPPSGLDPRQEQAIEYRGRALLIKAGPGTGKTLTLTRRIARLVQNGDAEPDEILALTFTNHAGGEMRSRLENLLGEKASRIFIGTFHSLAWKLLRQNAPEGAKLSIIDEDARNSLLKELAPELPAPRLKKAGQLIRQAKMLLLKPEQLKKFPQFPDWLPPVYKRYQERLARENCLDFDELIFQAVELLARKNSEAPDRFRWIFVDEYQDLDFAQYQMLKFLAGQDRNLCVIGDPDQAIYGFRGASPEFFQKFETDFPQAKIITLEKSFRLSEQILKASADALAAANRVPLVSGIHGPKLKLIELASERAEAEFIVHQIEKLVGGTGFFSFDSARVAPAAGEKPLAFADFAVLFRAGFQAEALLEAFSRSGIPCSLLSESPLKSRFFKAGISALRIASQESSPLALRLALQEIFGQENFTSEPKQLRQWLIRKNDARAQNLLQLLDKSRELSGLEICERAFSVAEAGETEASEKAMVKELALDLVRRKSEQTSARTPDQLLEILNLAVSQDFYNPDADRVSILTIHAAKGLEFEAVFVAGCEEGIIPILSARSEKEIEEEKRLFYVALTRAKSLLYLTRAKKRALHGAVSETRPSRFLLRIRQELLDKLKPEPLSPKPRQSQLDLF
jgi:uncharacterized protein (TIGR00375 family)